VQGLWQAAYATYLLLALLTAPFFLRRNGAQANAIQMIGSRTKVTAKQTTFVLTDGYAARERWLTTWHSQIIQPAA